MKDFVLMPETSSSVYSGYSSEDANISRVAVERFPDGEFAIKVPLTGDEVVLVGSCHSSEASEAFLAAAYEIARRGPKDFTIYNTYFRHARSERVVDGKANMAKFQARLWSGIGNVCPGVKIVLQDLHKDLVVDFFEGPVRVSNRSSIGDVAKFIARKIPNQFRNKSVVLGTVDEGGAYAVRKIAEENGLGTAIIHKVRLSGTETKVLSVHGEVAGKVVVILDDMISTGGSAIKAAQAFKDAGALGVWIGAAHGVFSVRDAVRMETSGLFIRIVVTQSHPNAEAAMRSCSIVDAIPLVF